MRRARHVGGDVLGRFERLHQRVLEHTHGVPVILASTALRAAIAAYGKIKKIGVVTPYMPAGDAHLRRYFEDEGFEVVQLLGLKSPSPTYRHACGPWGSRTRRPASAPS